MFQVKDGGGIGGGGRGLGGVGGGVIRNIVYGEILERNTVGVSACAFGQALDRGLVAYHQDPMTKIRDRRLYVLDAVDYQCSGSAAQERVFGISVHVRVIPLNPRGPVI